MEKTHRLWECDNHRNLFLSSDPICIGKMKIGKIYAVSHVNCRSDMLPKDYNQCTFLVITSWISLTLEECEYGINPSCVLLKSCRNWNSDLGVFLTGRWFLDSMPRFWAHLCSIPESIRLGRLKARWEDYSFCKNLINTPFSLILNPIARQFELRFYDWCAGLDS